MLKSTRLQIYWNKPSNSLADDLQYSCWNKTITADPTLGDIFECCFKAQSSKLERLFCHVSVKRDVWALSFELWKSFRKCHPKWDWLYKTFGSLVLLYLVATVLLQQDFLLVETVVLEQDFQDYVSTIVLEQDYLKSCSKTTLRVQDYWSLVPMYLVATILLQQDFLLIATRLLEQDFQDSLKSWFKTMLYKTIERLLEEQD